MTFYWLKLEPLATELVSLPECKWNSINIRNFFFSINQI